METLTYESVLNLILQQAASIHSTIREQAAASDASLEKMKTEFAKRMAESDAEFAKRMAESDASLEKMKAEFAKQIAESDAEFKQQMREINRKIADLTDTIGEAAEMQVKENVIVLFRSRNIILNEIFPRAIKENEDGTKLYEIDLLVVNSIYAVAVEVKNTLRQRDIDEHLKQIAKIQEKPMSCVKGKTLIGAVAGMIIRKEVENYAVKKGLFVIKPKNDTIDFVNSLDFKFKEWKIEKV